MGVPQSLVRYAIVGVFSNVSLYFLFIVLVWVGLNPLLVAGFCYIVGLVQSYFINRMWSFKSESSHKDDLIRFLFSYGVGFVATIVILAILTQWMRPEVAQILNVIFTALVIYSCLYITGFGRKGGRNVN